MKSAEVKETVELYFYSLSGLPWPVLGRTLLYFLQITKFFIMQFCLNFQVLERSVKYFPKTDLHALLVQRTWYRQTLSSQSKENNSPLSLSIVPLKY